MTLEDNTPQWIQDFVGLYNELSIDNLAHLKNIYHQDVQFVDPLKEVHGLLELKRYFEHLYVNTLSSEFVIESINIGEQQTALYWRMTLSHRRLNKAKPFVVKGHSQLKRKDGLIIFHRDYFDVGEMIYENIPVIGAIIRAIKKRANS